MARTSIFSFLAGPIAIMGPYDPPFSRTEEGLAYGRFFKFCLSVIPSIGQSFCPSLPLYLVQLHPTQLIYLNLGVSVSLI